MKVWKSNCRIYVKSRREKRGGSTMYRPSLHVKYIDHYLWVAPSGYIFEFVPVTYDRWWPDWLDSFIPPSPIFRGHLRIYGKVEFKE